MLRSNKVISRSIVSLIACFGVISTGYAFLSKINVTSLSEGQITTLKMQDFRLQPRFNLWGVTGDRTLAKTQLMMPLNGDNNSVLYAIGEGDYVKNDSSWVAGAGFGYRQIVDGKIFGGYAIADYLNTPQNGFVVLNPGLEVLGFNEVWDFKANGYIPLDNRKKLGKEGWAEDDFGNANYTRITGHSVFDYKMQEYEESGKGFDIEVGRVVPYFTDAKIYLGGYHFDTKNSGSINGVESRFVYDVNKYTAIELENHYDNLYKNKFTLGIRFSLGGYSQEEKQQFGLSARLLDPIEHNHIVANHKTVVSEGEALKHDNVWFIRSGTNANGVNGDGTAENPLAGFSPEVYNKIFANKDAGVVDKNPLMYFAPGEYSFNGFISKHGSTDYNNRFALPNGWGMYGRTADFKSVAMGNDRAKFIGGLDLNYANGNGAERTVLNSISVLSGESDGYGKHDNATLYINNASNVVLQNIKIVNDSSVGGATGNVYYHAMSVLKNSSVYFSDLSSGNGENIIQASGGYGIYSITSNLYFESGINRVISLDSPYGYAYGYYGGVDGFHIDDGSAVFFNGGQNYITAIYNRTNGDYVHVDALHVVNSSVIFNGGVNHLEANNKGVKDSDKSNGIFVYNPKDNFGGSVIEFNGGVNIIDSSSVYGISYGIYDSSHVTQSYGTMIRFANSSTNKVIINVNGAAKNDGINSSNSLSKLQYYSDGYFNTVTVSAANINNMNNYVAFNANYFSPSDKKIYLSDGTTLNW